jgi:hypothetical protein
MPTRKNTYTIKAKIWLYPGESGNWHFLTVPKKESLNIKAKYGAIARGWGSLPVSVTIGKTTWKTSIFPDNKSGTYILPLKAAVRKKEGVFEGDTVAFSFTV